MSDPLCLTKEQHEAVVNSSVGKFLSRLIAEEFKRGGDTSIPHDDPGNIVQRLWRAFHPGQTVSFEFEDETIKWDGGKDGRS